MRWVLLAHASREGGCGVKRQHDKHVFATVDEEEYALIVAMARLQQCSVSALIRRAINALAMECGDEMVFVESRRPWCRRKAKAA